MVAQRSRLVPSIQLFELFPMGMVSKALVVKGLAKCWIFIILLDSSLTPFFKWNENSDRKGLDFGL